MNNNVGEWGTDFILNRKAKQAKKRNYNFSFPGIQNLSLYNILQTITAHITICLLTKLDFLKDRSITLDSLMSNISPGIKKMLRQCLLN